MTDTLAGPADLDSGRDIAQAHTAASPGRAARIRSGWATRRNRIGSACPAPTGWWSSIRRTAVPSRYRPGSALASGRRIARGVPTRGARHRSAQSRYLVPGWPLKALLVGFPLWWVLGLTTFIFPILAVPMLIELRRRRPWRFPPFFWLWALYLLWTVLSLAMFKASPPGTHTTPTGGRLLSNAVTQVELASITITLLYVGALSVKEVSQQTIGRWMGWFFLTVVAGGFLGVVAPHFQFRSADRVRDCRATCARTTTSPRSSTRSPPRSRTCSGDAAGRPAAPFGYTNSWGNMLGILILWFIAAWVIPAKSWKRRAVRRHRRCGVHTRYCCPSTGECGSGWSLPVVWFGARLLAHGRLEVLVWGAGWPGRRDRVVLPHPGPHARAVPAEQRQEQRASAASSPGSRSMPSRTRRSSVTAVHRHSNGSAQSIAVGKTANCQSCGDVASGSTGQFWAIMFNQGVGGLVFYFGFFIACLWVYRRERTPIDEAALAAIAVVFVYMFFYNTLPAAPTLTMIGVGVLWRSHRLRSDITTADSSAATSREPATLTHGQLNTSLISGDRHITGQCPGAPNRDA